MTVNSTYSYPCHDVNVTGVVEIGIAIPHTGTVVSLGTSTDSIQITERGYYHDIPGDLNGGQQGPPIEIQKLGEVHTVNIRMSSWSKTYMQTVEKWYHTTRGTIEDDEVGQLMFASGVRARLLLNTRDLDDTRNYWNAIMREPKSFSIGSKYTEQSLTFECHRCRCGEDGDGSYGEDIDGVIYDKHTGTWAELGE